MKKNNLRCWSWAPLIALTFFTASFCMAQQAPKVALVIGNSAYKSAPLRNPGNDAKDIADVLRGLGFTVMERIDLTSQQIDPTLRDFQSKLIPDSVAIVFYSGHCIKIKGDNYLPSVNANFENEENFPAQSLSVNRLMNVLAEGGTRANLVFLDACTEGQETVPPRSLISFAARPGTAVLDGDGRNGVYTSALLQQLKQTNLPIDQILEKVASDVKRTSKGKQEPWTQGRLAGNFCLIDCEDDVGRNSADDESWEIVKKINTLAGYQAYLASHPDGRHKPAAEVAIKAFGGNLRNSPKASDPVWVKLVTAGPDAGKDAGATFYLNSSILSKDFPIKKLELLEDFPAPISIQDSTMNSAILKIEFNCSTSMFRLITFEMMSDRMGRGDVFKVEKGDTWRDTPSDFHMLHSLACKK